MYFNFFFSVDYYVFIHKPTEVLKSIVIYLSFKMQNVYAFLILNLYLIIYFGMCLGLCICLGNRH